MGDSRSGAAQLHLTTDEGQRERLEQAYHRASECHGDIAAALALAVEIAREAPRPGTGSTAELWELLATVAAADPTVARAIEPHLDAIAILGELPEPADLDAVGASEDSTWGVFAAEGPGTVLEADLTDDGWRLTGTKPWCSLADRLSHALVTAHHADGSRGLFAVALRDDTVSVPGGTWVARGLRDVPSGPVDFAGTVAVPVGAPGWYLERPGFAWGGIGVAAIWWGSAVGIARLLDERSRTREPDQIASMHLGAADVALWAARATLLLAAAQVDDATLERAAAGLLANRTRTVVAEAAAAVIRRVGHALGPAPLALDERHSGRVADLELYLRQHHAERDEAAIGRALSAGDQPW